MELQAGGSSLKDVPLVRGGGSKRPHLLMQSTLWHRDPWEMAEKPNLSLEMTQFIGNNIAIIALFPLSDPSDSMKYKRGVRTLEAGRETGSKAKALIRRSCRCEHCKVFDISFNFSSSLPGMI